MSFEMLGSRYLNPYFGSGIYAWTGLISMVLAALMPSARHDMQRQRSEHFFLGLTPMHSTASTIIARRDFYGLMS